MRISGIIGSDLRRISSADQMLQDYEVLKTVNRLYFRSIEDLNENGRIDSDDKPHYFYLNLTSEALKVTEYFPLDGKEK